MEKEEEMNNWKQFQGTELGSLMSSIYGNQNRPKINYPKPKTKPMTKEQMEKGFHYAGSKPGASDPRKVTRTNVKVNVPIPATAGSKIPAIESVIPTPDQIPPVGE